MVILDFGAIVDCCDFVGGKLALLTQWVVVLGEHSDNLFIHGEAASAFVVILC